MPRYKVYRSSGSIFITIVLLYILFALLFPPLLRYDNVMNTLRQCSALGILAVGQSLVIISGGVDLSVAAIMQVAVVIMAELAKFGNISSILGIIIAIATGGVIGLFNGFLISRFRLQPFLVTLFSGAVVTGLRLALTRGSPSGIVPDLLRVIGRDSTFGIPNAVITFLIIATIVQWILSNTVFGRYLYAVGQNYRAALVAGIRVQQTLTQTYVLSGLLSGLAGLVLAGYIGYADQWIGKGYELDSLAAAAIGGTRLGGGEGSVIGTIGGVLLVTLVVNLVLLLNLDAPFQYVAKGLVLILSVVFASLLQARGAVRRNS